MKYTIFLILCVCIPAHTYSLDLTYKIDTDWQYCERHRKECDEIGQFDDTILPKFEMTPQVSKEQWAMFVVLQAADIYTTYKGLQYDCVRELNPIIGETPTVTRMLVTKTIILAPAIQYDMSKGNLSDWQMDQVNTFMSLVIANNYNVYKRAKRLCTKKR